jgi:hypothetical protein
MIVSNGKTTNTRQWIFKFKNVEEDTWHSIKKLLGFFDQLSNFQEDLYYGVSRIARR